MRVVFMGTPDFSVPALKKLAQHQDVVAVVTQKDRPKGRGHKMQYTPVKEEALSYNIPVYQPEKVKDNDFVNLLKEMQPDVIVVIAFGQILSKEILDIPKYGCINVHASLLPKYRGAAPIQWAVIDGEEVSGVTTMYMAEGLDTGDIIDTIVVKLDKKETGGSLFEKLSCEGAELIVKTLKALEEGTAKRIPQDDKLSSYAGKITKELGCIDFSKSAKEIECLIRGLNPWPSAYTYMDGKIIKIWDASVIDENSNAIGGTILELGKDFIKVATGDGILQINELQMEGKKRMTAAAFLNGYTVTCNCLGK